MPDPLKELDKALGILSDVEPRIKAPDNYKRISVTFLNKVLFV